MEIFQIMNEAIPYRFLIGNPVGATIALLAATSMNVVVGFRRMAGGGGPIGIITPDVFNSWLLVLSTGIGVLSLAMISAWRAAQKAGREELAANEEANRGSLTARLQSAQHERDDLKARLEKTELLLADTIRALPERYKPLSAKSDSVEIKARADAALPTKPPEPDTADFPAQ